MILKKWYTQFPLIRKLMSRKKQIQYEGNQF